MTTTFSSTVRAMIDYLEPVIAYAITERTRAIIANTPHNPSGRIITPRELESLARALSQAPRPVYFCPTSRTTGSFRTAASIAHRSSSTTASSNYRDGFASR